MSNDTDTPEPVHAPECARRLENAGKHFWADLTLFGKQCNAINIGQGFPDWPPPDHIKNALIEVAHSDDYALHQYARSFGHPRLVNIMAKIYSQIFSRTIDPMDNILITVGASNALYDCAHAYINPGDEAIIIEPCFDVCESQVRMASGIPVSVPLRLVKNNHSDAKLSSKNWKLDFDELESKFSSKTKLLYITDPHNPTGKVFEKDELLKIASLVEKYNVTVIADEVYEWIVYDNMEMIKFANLPGMWKRTLTIGSVGKTFNVTGWKMGWIIAPHNLLKNIQTVHHNVVIMCPTPLQEAVAIVFEKEFPLLNTPSSYFKQLLSDLQRKQDRMAELILKMGLIPLISDGSYFMLADFSKLENNSFNADDGLSKSFAFVKWFCKEKKILGTPLSPFYSNCYKILGDNMIRFCFCKKDATFEAVEQLVDLWQSRLQ